MRLSTKFSCTRSLCGAFALSAICCLPMSGWAQAGTARMVSAADRFLGTLSPKQRAAVLYKFDDAEQRKRWSNFPTGFIPRGGIGLKEMMPGAAFGGDGAGGGGAEPKGNPSAERSESPSSAAAARLPPVQPAPPSSPDA